MLVCVLNLQSKVALPSSMAPKSPVYFNFVAKALLICAFLVHASVSFGAFPTLLSTSDHKVSEGYIGLSWKQLPEVTAVQLQVGFDADLEQVIRSPVLTGQQQVHLSGFADGVYFARLVDGSGDVLSNTVSFEVEHRPLRAASLLFAIGAALFCFLVITLFRFARTDS